jgi:hypothetical protein
MDTSQRYRLFVRVDAPGMGQGWADDGAACLFGPVQDQVDVFSTVEEKTEAHRGTRDAFGRDPCTGQHPAPAVQSRRSISGQTCDQGRRGVQRQMVTLRVTSG